MLGWWRRWFPTLKISRLLNSGHPHFTTTRKRAVVFCRVAGGRENLTVDVNEQRAWGIA